MQMDHGNHQKLAKATKLPHRLGTPSHPIRTARFLQPFPANLHPCFQQLAGVSSRNLFPFMLLQCCPGVVGLLTESSKCSFRPLNVFRPSHVPTFKPIPRSIPFLFIFFRTLWRNGAITTPLQSNISALFLMQRRGGSILPIQELLSHAPLVYYKRGQRWHLLSILSPFAFSAGEVEWKG